MKRLRHSESMGPAGHHIRIDIDIDGKINLVVQPDDAPAGFIVPLTRAELLSFNVLTARGLAAAADAAVYMKGWKDCRTATVEQWGDALPVPGEVPE